MKRRNKPLGALGQLRRFGGKPVNNLTARVVNYEKKNGRDDADVLARALRTKDDRYRDRLLKESNAKDLDELVSRTIGSEAEARARKALERSRWARNNARR